MKGGRGVNEKKWIKGDKVGVHNSITKRESLNVLLHENQESMEIFFLVAGGGASGGTNPCLFRNISNGGRVVH